MLVTKGQGRYCRHELFKNWAHASANVAQTAMNLNSITLSRALKNIYILYVCVVVVVVVVGGGGYKQAYT